MPTLSANKVWYVMLLQLGLTIVIVTALSMIGRIEAMSGLTGGLAATIGNGFFAGVVFRRYSDQGPGRILGSYYTAEFVKLVLIALIFLMAILFMESLSIAAMLGVYLVVHLASSVFVIILEGHKKN